MILALIFAELLAGGVMLTSAITGHSIPEVIKGQSKGILPLKDSKSPFAKAGEQEAQASEGLLGEIGGAFGVSNTTGAPETGATSTGGAVAPGPAKAGSGGIGWQALEKLVKEGRVPENIFKKALKELESGQLAHIKPLPPHTKQQLPPSGFGTGRVKEA